MLGKRGTTSQESSVQALLGVLPTRLSSFLIELTPSLLLLMQTCALPSSVEGVGEVECEEEDVATAVCCSPSWGYSLVCVRERYSERCPSRTRECYWCVSWHPAIDRHWMLAAMSRVCLLPVLSVIFLQSTVGWFYARFYTCGPSALRAERRGWGHWRKGERLWVSQSRYPNLVGE